MKHPTAGGGCLLLTSALQCTAVCLASALPSCFTSAMALGCQAPRLSTARGRKAMPWQWQVSHDLSSCFCWATESVTWGGSGLVDHRILQWVDHCDVYGRILATCPARNQHISWPTQHLSSVVSPSSRILGPVDLNIPQNQ